MGLLVLLALNFVVARWLHGGEASDLVKLITVVLVYGEAWRLIKQEAKEC